MDSFVIVWAVAALVFGAIGAAIAATKDQAAGFWLGLLLGPIGLLIVAIMRLSSSPQHTPAVAQDAANAQATKACPDCAETILAAARKCRYCGADVSASVPAVPTPPAPVPAERQPIADKSCPFCRGIIPGDARRCAHCMQRVGS